MVRKHLLSFCLIAGFYALGVQSVNAQVTLAGQDNPGLDFHFLQMAMADGGTILLKGTFNLGDTGRVIITKDVKIIGEKDEKGAPVTKIKGGYWSLHSPLPPKLPPETPGPQVTIQNIHFDGALWAPIHLSYCSGATITNNKFTNLRPFPPYPIKPKTCYLMSGVLCGTYWAQNSSLRMQQKYQSDAFTGELIISDNEIDMENPTPELTLGQGIFVQWTTGVKAKITNNKIFNCSRNSIETLDNSLDKDGNGIFTIQDNIITSSKIGVPVPSPRTPNGIVVGWFLDPTGLADPKRNNKYMVMNNSVKVLGRTSMGIYVAGSDAVIKSNHISTDGAEATALFLGASNCSVAENKIEGSGKFGCVIGPLGKMAARGNKLDGNIFSQFKAAVANVMIQKGADENTVTGDAGTLSDEGAGNKISGMKLLGK